ncbi:4Fe-4S dicluster domain-containing protein [Actinomadura parmotrematis]|uniref:DUF3390 domain-containing protein n=1 Tax=Actinomadura parmotrematis TaxID=2864039 RepID=A0ABS7FQX9_9ACTN|nr:4Fe-4S dicluster domain-containing protein [Actinomadura parmotrematis]MBW8482796.1 DUF3390 domain-containing protein [Actinomadura parmotrematis]
MSGAVPPAGTPPPPPPPPPRFADAAREALADPSVRRGLREATSAARAGAAGAVADSADWEELRAAGAAVRDRTLLDLDRYLEELEGAVVEAGGTVHWAVSAADAVRVVAGLVRAQGESGAAVADAPVLREIGLAGGLAAAGIAVLDAGAAAAVAVTGVDFMVAETGALVRSGGDAAPAPSAALVAVAGLEQAVPAWRDLEVFLQLLPRASGAGRTAARTVVWSGPVAGDGPAACHLVLVDNGRTRALADPVGRTALRCIGCEACLNVCPVYERTGPAAYGPGGAGPIGAVRVPLQRGVRGAHAASLPFASTLCGACADVCPVKIDLPGLLVHLRGEVVEARRDRPVPAPELAAMRAAAWTLAEPRRYEAALRRGARWGRLLARGGRIGRLPGRLGKWSDARDLPAPPAQSFRAWWGRR